MKLSVLFETSNDSHKALLSMLKSALLSDQPAGSSRITSSDIQEDSNSLGIRYWGQWEVPQDEEDDGDYDWQVLSVASSRKLNEIIMSFEKQHKCKVICQTSEKNWIECKIQ